MSRAKLGNGASPLGWNDGRMEAKQNEYGTLQQRLIVAGLWFWIGLTGCQQPGFYPATTLPAEYDAPRVSSWRNVDFSRLARTPGSSELIYPGDVVEVAIRTGLAEEDEPTFRLRVAENGTAKVPLIGDVPIAGQGLTTAEGLIREAGIRGGAYVDPQVSVTMFQRRSHRVTIVGAVKEPGTRELPAAASDILTAITMAGGMTAQADTILEIRRPLPSTNGMSGATLASYSPQGDNANPYASPANEVVEMDLEQLSPESDLRLPDGSTVVVRPKPKRFIHVIGLVHRANQFELPEDQELRLLDAVALAGGCSISIADKVHVIRYVPDQPAPIVVTASLRKAKSNSNANIRLAAGDVVSVEETPTTFVVGTIRDFVRFGFSSAIPGF